MTTNKFLKDLVELTIGFQMRLPLIVFCLFLSCCQVSRADIVVTLTQATPGPIVLGNFMDFNLKMRAASGTVDNSGGIASANGIAGIDFRVNAADPTHTGIVTVGGVFISGTSDYFPASNPDPYQFPFPSSFAYFASNNGSGLALGTTDQLIATLRLDTTDATIGTYTMGLTGLSFVGPAFAPFTVSAASTSSISYTITAVPEPNSIVLFGLAVAGVALNRIRNRNRRIFARV